MSPSFDRRCRAPGLTVLLIDHGLSRHSSRVREAVLVLKKCGSGLTVRDFYDVYGLQHISVSNQPPRDQVYEFASKSENLSNWAAGLSGSYKKVNEDWIAESPMGQ